jgi:hypothetical protein
MTRSSIFYIVSGMQGGFRGASRPPLWKFGGNIPEKCFLPRFSCHLDFCVHCWVVFQHMVFFDGFLFSVKELEC